MWTFCFHCIFQQPDSERGRNSTRYGSTSRKPIVSNNRPSSSGEQNEGRLARLSSSNGRPYPVQRIQPPFARTPAARGTTRDDPLRSFEFLSIRK